MRAWAPEEKKRKEDDGMQDGQEKITPARITDDTLACTAGGYVVINAAGCYDLYNENGTYVKTFRGDQLEQLRKYARQHGISDEFQSS